MKTQELLDMAAYTVATLSDAKDKSSQVNALLEVLSSRTGRDGILAVQERLVYQSSRKEILPRAFCARVYEDLCAILDADVPSEEGDKERFRLARQYLTHLKRLYRGVQGRRIKIDNREGAFDELARKTLLKTQSEPKKQQRSR